MRKIEFEWVSVLLTSVYGVLFVALVYDAIITQAFDIAVLRMTSVLLSALLMLNYAMDAIEHNKTGD